MLETFNAMLPPSCAFPDSCECSAALSIRFLVSRIASVVLGSLLWLPLHRVVHLAAICVLLFRM